MIGRHWLGRALVSAIIALAPRLAVAQVLEWEAPEGCPQVDAVRARLAHALGRSDAALISVSSVRGIVAAEASGYRLTLELVDAGQRSSRSLRSSDCDDLASAAALAIALAEHAATTPGAGADAAAAPATEPADASVTAPDSGHDRGTAADDAADAAAATPRARWSVGPSAVLDVGALPEPALGLGLVGRVGLPALELDVHGTWLPSQQLGVGTGEAVELGLAAAGLRACLRRSLPALVLGGCVGTEAGLLSATGRGLEPERAVHDLWLAAGPAILARSAFAGPLQLEMIVEPLLPLARKRYAVDESDVVHEPWVVDLRVIATLSIGLGRARP